MKTYAITNNYGLSPDDVQSVLIKLGVENCGVQVLHYTQPRIVLVMTENELSPEELQGVQEAIADIRGIDPKMPKG